MRAIAHLLPGLGRAPREVATPPAPPLAKQVKDFFVCDHPNTATFFQKTLAWGGFVGGAVAMTAAVLQHGVPGIGEAALATAVAIAAMAAVSLGAAKFHEREDHHADDPIADDFNFHHARPQAITVRSFADHSWQTACMTTPLLLGVAAIQLTPLAMYFWETAGVTMLLSMPTWGQQFHKWAHMRDEAPGIAKVVQWCRGAVSPEDHLAHHRDKYDTNYDVMTGWFNRRALSWLVGNGTSPHHAKEGVTPFPLLSREERQATVRARNALLHQQSDPTATPDGFATLRGGT